MEFGGTTTSAPSAFENSDDTLGVDQNVSATPTRRSPGDSPDVEAPSSSRRPHASFTSNENSAQHPLSEINLGTPQIPNRERCSVIIDVDPAQHPLSEINLGAPQTPNRERCSVIVDVDLAQNPLSEINLGTPQIPNRERCSVIVDVDLAQNPLSEINLGAPQIPNRERCSVIVDVDLAQNPLSEINLGTPQIPNRERCSVIVDADSLQNGPEDEEARINHIACRDTVTPKRPVDVSLSIGTTTTLKGREASVVSLVYKKWSSAWERCRRIFKPSGRKASASTSKGEDIGMVVIDVQDAVEDSDSDDSLQFDESSDSDDDKWERIATLSRMKQIMASRRSKVK